MIIEGKDMFFLFNIKKHELTAEKVKLFKEEKAFWNSVYKELEYLANLKKYKKMESTMNQLKLGVQVAKKPYQGALKIKQEQILDQMTEKQWKRTQFFYMEFCYRSSYIISQNIEILSKNKNPKEYDKAVAYSEKMKRKMIYLSLLRRLDER